MKKPIIIKKEKPVVDPELCEFDIETENSAFIHTEVRKRKKNRIYLMVKDSYDADPLAVVKMNLHEAKLLHAVLGVHINQLEGK